MNNAQRISNLMDKKIKKSKALKENEEQWLWEKLMEALADNPKISNRALWKIGLEDCLEYTIEDIEIRFSWIK